MDAIDLSIFANNTKLCDVVNTLQGRVPIQRDLHSLETWTSANLMKSNKAMCKVLHVSWGNPKLKYGLGREWIESSPVSQAAAHYKGTKHAKKLKALEAMKNKQKSVTTKDSAKTTFTSITTNTINTSSDKTADSVSYYLRQNDDLGGPLVPLKCGEAVGIKGSSVHEAQARQTLVLAEPLCKQHEQKHGRKSAVLEYWWVFACFQFDMVSQVIRRYHRDTSNINNDNRGNPEEQCYDN
ncbi:hypothetical protein BTVI_31736 [Pitangus sulphuratus]|nr:hypothetical protein BTVI_31736 [Pitangus sulphuratus]